MQIHGGNMHARAGTRSLFLAPHYDDAALSCGGTIALLADAGIAPLVVTVFGGAPEPGGLSDFARWQHDRWGSGANDAVNERRAEDRRASAILGCESWWFEYRDAIYRGQRYLADEALFGPPSADDSPLIDAIAQRLLALREVLDGGTLYVPLAVGNHVDHQLVFEAGRLLAARGLEVLAYEDFPYAALEDALARRLDAVAAVLGEPVVVDIGMTIARRVEAIAAYPSQLPVIFRFWPSMPDAVNEFARHLGTTFPAERYWPVRLKPV